MKIIRIILLVAFLVSSVAVNAMSKPPHGGGGCVSTPLDGGLLGILAAAGIVYFVARKGKKKES
jgi:hypothetical protein